MILDMPGAGGMPERQDIPNTELAQRFWASSWGLRAHLEHQEPSVALMTYLTAGRHLGGLQATWKDHSGLHALRDLITGTGGLDDQETPPA